MVQITVSVIWWKINGFMVVGILLSCIYFVSLTRCTKFWIAAVILKSIFHQFKSFAKFNTSMVDYVVVYKLDFAINLNFSISFKIRITMYWCNSYLHEWNKMCSILSFFINLFWSITVHQLKYSVYGAQKHCNEYIQKIVVLIFVSVLVN